MEITDSGRDITRKTVRMALEAARENGIKHMVLASNTGYTATVALEEAKRAFGREKTLSIVCVTHMVGYAADGEDEMEEPVRKMLATEGVAVLTTTHLFGGVERSMSSLWKGAYPLNMVATALKLFGQGAKVAVEVSVMALDSGLIPFGEDVIALGGSGRGADTAFIIRPAHSTRFFDTRIKKVIALSN